MSFLTIVDPQALARSLMVGSESSEPGGASSFFLARPVWRNLRFVS
jgi:hypothetical protein